MKELKVGDRITFEVVEGSGCSGCYFEGRDNCPGGCCSCERPDGKDVIFKEVKE